MNKKLFYILFFLFLAGILYVSCSNNDKTGTSQTITIEQAKGNTYHSEEDNTKYVSINKYGSITIKVNPEPDYFTKDIIKHISGNKYTFAQEPGFEDIYTIEFTDNGNKITLIYGSKEHPLYFIKKN